MPIPQTPRFGELLRRAFITKEYPSPTVLDDYFPSIDLFSDKPELLRLRGEQTFCGGDEGFGGAGTVGAVWCVNRTPSQLVIIDKIEVGMQGAAAFVMAGLQNNPGAFPVPGNPFLGQVEDSRYNVNLASYPAAPVDFTGVTIANASDVILGIAPLGSTVIWPVRYVLKPSWALLVRSGLVGAGNNIFVRFEGYARGVEDSELKG